MRLLEAAAVNLRQFAVLGGLVIAFGLSLGIGLTATGVLATHADPNTIHACVNPFSKVARIVEDPARCAYYEDLVEWQGAAGSAALEARVAALETQVGDLVAQLGALQTGLDTLNAQVPDCLSTAGASDLNTTLGDAVFSGCNVHVRSGSGGTAGAINGLGNLIVGYNEENVAGEERTGSHNLVVGPEHSYSSYGGFVAGVANTISAPYASVSGGGFNTASGAASSVSSGAGNTASGEASSVSGGAGNTASGDNSSVTGGLENEAGGDGNPNTSDFTTVTGGHNGVVTDLFDSLIGNAAFADS